MVSLVNPDPPNPEAGKRFSITASLGVPPYTFRYRIGEGNTTTKVQGNPKLTISIPSGTSGKELVISVEDGGGDKGSNNWIISLPGQGE